LGAVSWDLAYILRIEPSDRGSAELRAEQHEGLVDAELGISSRGSSRRDARADSGLGFGASGHADPVALVVLWLAIILVAAKLGGELAVRLGQTAVPGELLVGVVLGNVVLVGFSGLEPIKADPSVDMLAGIGMLLLLFEVGLESTVGGMLKVGVSALLVALLGVAAPFGLGWGVSAWLLPGSSAYVHAFLGATLTATSVGITARVLRDLGRSQSEESRVILGAAVIDDILGLVILAVVGGVIAAADLGASISFGDVGLILESSHYRDFTVDVRRIVSSSSSPPHSRTSSTLYVLIFTFPFVGVGWPKTKTPRSSTTARRGVGDTSAVGSLYRKYDPLCVRRSPERWSPSMVCKTEAPREKSMRASRSF
jgi:Sodium/hydrogen exchanger family